MQKFWKDLFNSSEAEGISIASKEDVEQIIDILVADKINPQVFLSNLEALLLRGRPSFNDFFGVGEKKKHKPTESVSHFTSIVNKPFDCPLWFLAAYPDVMHWYKEEMKKYIIKSNGDYNGWGLKSLKLFGIHIADFLQEDGILNENQIMNSEEKFRPGYLKNLVQSYKDTTGKELETVVKNIEDDIYAGAEFLENVGAESNFTFIAENTTKYYLELVKNYSDRFNDESSLLAAAGILDAQVYIFMKQINPKEILDMARESLGAGKDPLINFIIDLEVKLFEVDIPNIDPNVIRDACEEQRQNIEKIIQKLKEEYTSESHKKSLANLFIHFASEASKFMNSAKFEPYRKMLGIKNNIFN